MRIQEKGTTTRHLSFSEMAVDRGFKDINHLRNDKLPSDECRNHKIWIVIIILAALPLQTEKQEGLFPQGVSKYQQ